MNTSSDPVPVTEQNLDAGGNVKVHEQGTANVNGTVGIDSSKNTVNLDATDSGRLASIDAATSKLKFDGSGNLETSGAPGSVTQQCSAGGLPSKWFVPRDFYSHALCSGDLYVTDIIGAGMDDELEIQFKYGSSVVMDLWGGDEGANSYQLDLTHPIHVDDIEAFCFNAFIHGDCNFTLIVLGNSTGK